MKHFLKIVLLLLILLFSIATVFAHPGRTDAKGGHHDTATGEYHYHHGYSAHSHYDMDNDGDVDCPYDFDDKTGVNSGSSTNNNSSEIHTTYTNSANNNNAANNEKVTEVPSWVYWAFAGLAYLIIHLFISNLSRKTELRDMESRHKHELSKIKESCDSEIETRLAAVDQLDVLKEKILDAEKVLCKTRMLVNIEYENLDNVKIVTKRMKGAPLNIAFAQNGLPIYWKPTIEKPYGDYTVFVNKDKTIYHTDRLCASYTASENHIFNVLGTARPCRKCAEGFFDFDTAPDWFVSPQAVGNTKP